MKSTAARVFFFLSDDKSAPCLQKPLLKGERGLVSCGWWWYAALVLGAGVLLSQPVLLRCDAVCERFDCGGCGLWRFFVLGM